MKVVTPDQMRRWDSETIERIGIPGIVLMERASLEAANTFCEFFELTGDETVGVLCGAGNNGGDGFAIARILSERDISVSVYSLTETHRGDAKINRDILTTLGMSVRAFTPDAQHSIWIDAVFGTGLDRIVENEYADAIEFLNRQQMVFSIDVPSGLDSGTGKALGEMVWADATVTFAAPKVGLVIEPGRSAAGVLFVADIGIPEVIEYDVGWELDLLVPPRDLPPRPSQFHKGDAGKVLVVGGDMLGAVLFASDACMQSGAGLVKLASDFPSESIAGAVREVMATGTDDILELVRWADVTVIGPGFGTSRDREGLFETTWVDAKSLVVDADGLNLMSDHLDLWQKRSGATVITPHPGEMARLCQTPVADVLADPIGVAQSFSETHNCIVVLKTEATVVAEPNGRTAVNATGNPGMASAGMGDVLAGVIAARLADGFQDPFVAVCDAVCAHGESGDLVAQEEGELGVTASKVIEALGTVWRSWEYA